MVGFLVSRPLVGLILEHDSVVSVEGAGVEIGTFNGVRDADHEGSSRDSRGEILRAACEEFASYLSEVTDGDVGWPTPCEEWSVADLYRHMLEMSAAVAGVAPPAEDAFGLRLDEELRETTYRRFARLAIEALEGESDAAWHTYLANTLIHTWDLARAIGFDYDPPEAEILSIAVRSLEGIADEERGVGALYGYVPNFPALSDTERMLLLSGRMPVR